ncbi:hypothetical protein B0I26_102165 [Anoxybacillus vitaminiphilus]|uniref:Uncharacterized protein n=1 Tax=Paranoxybacillus vitaminiphilus TaxID=581036 RepID=A0A327YPF8_9BACL|nr:hypothetical protein [Anoxybacillus vitaminiphilus]RAK22176.1 hypothetical protein B0I26_102165 [Anoxybacillus vitaminiphilus]
MDGIYFYWFSWMLWVIYTFLMKKDKVRILFAVTLLMLIALSIYEISIGPFQLTLSYLFILFMAFYFAAMRSRWQFIYMLIGSMIVTLAYVSFQLFALFDPIWVFLDRTWMLAVILTIIVILLYGGFYSRLLCFIIGSCQGDFLYAVILKRFSFPHVIGSLAFFDMLLLSWSLMFGWFVLENASAYVDLLAQKGMKETKQS